MNAREKSAGVIVWIMRAAVVITALGAFFANVNPIRLCGLVSRNASLFTVAISYDTFAKGFSRALTKGWVEQSTVTLMYISALILFIGIVILVVGWCMSIGELKMKRTGMLVAIGGCVVSLAALMLTFPAQSQLWNTIKQTKVEPVVSPFTVGFMFFAITLGVVLISSLISYIMLPKPAANMPYEMKPKYQLFLLMLPAIIMVALFSYLPLYGWRYAFFNYSPGKDLTAADFVGLDYFKMLVSNGATRNDILRVLRNTLAMSAFGIFGQWIPMAFAIFLAEVSNSGFRKVVQTVTTIPNFISWVLVYTVAFALFSSDGFVNQVLIMLGVIDTGHNFLLDGNLIWLKMWLWGMWKGLGWSAIVYIAAISGIDQELYEAATVDGAGRFHKMWHITVPGLMPTFWVLLLLAIAGILSNGMDQYFVFKNAVNKDTIEVLDLYTYTLGLGSASTSTGIPLSTLVGMLKSIISIILLFGANSVSKLLRGSSIV